MIKPISRTWIRLIELFVITSLSTYPLISSAVEIVDTIIQSRVLVRITWGSGKTELGEVPSGMDKTPSESINPIAVDTNNNVYIADSINYRVLKFNDKGEYLLEIDLKKYDDWPYQNIPDITIDKNDDVYIVILRKQQIVKYNPKGKEIAIFNLSNAGVLNKDKAGIVHLDAKKKFNISRVLLDTIGHIYVLGSEQNIIKLNQHGKILQRWGPNASNALNFIFIDPQNNLYIWMPPGENKSMFKRYDVSGAFIGSGLGIYDQIIEPFYHDSSGNVIGFAFTDNQLSVYSPKRNMLVKLPIKEESLAFERWTVSPKGDIYYTKTIGVFELLKVTLPDKSR